ncbi:MAG: hypothetical protein V4773_05830 [Verrucomicrobiota bacterium]
MTSARPNLLRPAALVSLLIFILGATGLFALSYANRQSAAALDRLSAMHAARVAAVGAQVSFKTQVQEWKNILLRGQVAADLQSHRERFDARAADVQAGLRTVETHLKTLGLDAATATRLASEHTTLLETYRRALGDFRPEDPRAPFTTDRAVRGIDRKLNDDIDALARDVEQTASEELAAFTAASSARYATLRKTTLGVSVVAVLAALWLVFQANRAARPA